MDTFPNPSACLKQHGVVEERTLGVKSKDLAFHPSVTGGMWTILSLPSSIYVELPGCALRLSEDRKLILHTLLMPALALIELIVLDNPTCSILSELTQSYLLI